MIFRRSLVRELTATAVGLFVILLAILFTNLVLRLLARAAGGAVAPEGILALLGFNALFYLNILLSVALFLPVLFHEFRRGNVVVFVESINSFDGTIHNIFLHSIENGKDVITVARSGMLEEADNGDRFIVLLQGRRYEGEPGTSDYRIVEFERLGRRIEPAELRALPVSSKAIPTPTLMVIDGNVERAEMFWRISVPISALMLTLLAVPLAQVNPRMGRSFNLISARSEEHTSELQSRPHLVCRLLLEKKKQQITIWNNK